MNKFNLTFTGEVLPGQDLERVKSEFAKLFGVTDRSRLELFFAGKPVTLRRNLERKEAAALYARLHQAGADVALEKVIPGHEESSPKTITPHHAKQEAAQPEPPRDETKTPANRGMDHEIREAHPGRIDQSWPVARARLNQKASTSKKTDSGDKKRTTQALPKEDETQRRAQEEADRQKAEEEARHRAQEEAARKQAEKDEAERRTREEAARKKAEEEAQRRAQEETARKQAEKDEAERRAREEAARKKAEEETQRRALEEAARKKAEADEAERRAREEAARKKAEEETQRRAREEADRKRAEKEAAERRAREEAARRKAEEEAQRRALKEAARKKAEKEETERRAREEAARKKAEEEAQRRALEEAARKKAEQEEARRKAREEAARRKAEQAEARRKAREEAAAEAARVRAEKRAAREAEAAEKARVNAERKQQRDEERARIKAKRQQEAAAKKLARDEERKKRSEEKALEAAKKLDAKKRAAARAAQQKEILAEQKRLEAKQRAEAKAEQKRRHEEEFARLKQQKAAEKAKREALERAAREKSAQEVLRMEALQAEQRRLEAEESARLEAEKLARLEAAEKAEQEQIAREARRQQALAEEAAAEATRQAELRRQEVEETRRRIKQETARSLAAGELSAESPGKTKNKLVPKKIGRSKSARPPVKTSLHVPSPSEATPTADQAHKPRRQPGAPNSFNLRPFRNNTEIRQRAARSKQWMQVALAICTVSLTALLILSARFMTLPVVSPLNGASNMATDSQGGLTLLAGDTLFIHDRAGVGTAALPSSKLGLAEITFDSIQYSDNALLLSGRLLDSERIGLLSCQLEELACTYLTPEQAIDDIAGLAVNPLSRAVILARQGSGELLKLSPNGDVVARIALNRPGATIIRLRSGLIYINSADAPAIGVFRPDDQAFGQQLDEILLLPEPAVSQGQSLVKDFTWGGTSWWVTLENPESQSAGVYRFDEKWDYLAQIQLPEDHYPDQLLTWSDRILVLDRSKIAIQRFNAEGQIEAALVSDIMQTYIAEGVAASELSFLLWWSTLALLFTVGLGAAIFAALHYYRMLVYRQGQERGAEPLNDREFHARWIDHDPGWPLEPRKTGAIYLILSIGLLALLGLYAGSVLVVIAVTLILSGPALMAFWLHSSPPGHVGVLDDQLLLVDHRNYYHTGKGPRILYRNHFLLIDDVLVFTGTGPLPIFDRKQLQELIVPLASAGIRVDRKTVMIKALQCGHPLARGGLFCLASSTLAVILLGLAWGLSPA